MSANPIDQNATPKPTGSLEELFRHHLGEEAAVPPRPMLWDQIDNSLLIKQNDLYRRRLTATRWVAAASILLASLAGTGWWVGRDALLSSSEVAAVATPAASRTGVAAREAVAAAPAGTGRRASNESAASAAATSPALAALTAGSAGRPATPASSAAAATTSRAPGFGTAQTGPRYVASAAPYGGRQRYQMPATATTTVAAAPSNVSLTAPSTSAEINPVNPTIAVATAPDNGEQNASAATIVAASAPSVSAAASVAAAGGTAADGAAAGSIAAALVPAATPAAISSAVAIEEAGLLAAHSTTLAFADAQALPTGLAEVAVPAELPVITDAHRWHYSGSYAAGVFNPNINFSRAGIEPTYAYNASPAFGPDSPALTESAAAEYRNNLRPGFSQRLALLATRHLQGHWSVSTGVEVSQATAHSASSSAFVGEQLFDLGQTKNMPAQPLQTTDFRYRLASVPIEVRYSNPVKQGWSFYGRLSGVVSALLGVRSDVEGNPEATRTYSLLSAGSPYRQVLASVRGGAGAQFRTSSGKWALSAGPVADLGLVSLNAHPAQSYFAQSRPYSLGLEAAIEFGR